MKKNSKRTKTNATAIAIAAQTIAEQITENAKPTSPTVSALIQRIGAIAAHALKDNGPTFGEALRQIDNTARAYWTAAHTEGRAIMFRVSTVCTAAAKHGPESFAHALNEIEAAARNYWKQNARA
ncbi:MAG TPA: hypothetical protein PKE12_09785 [Kiritimatiellia bacterium]|nr:hypothetical protein [Kiritimatiellia bacterium]